MPAGWPYFAWIDASETAFGSEHLRWDEQVFSFKLSQKEGDPAQLTAQVRRPRNEAGGAIGLLGPDRKIWCWFAFDCGPDLIRFRGRLVGIPTSIFDELVTLEFVAKPIDVVAQKAALADTLRVLPYYDEAVIDEQRRDDPELVLEGYTKIWHYDRETHVITVSDEIVGEDGTVAFDGVSDTGKVLYDGLGLTLSSGPLARVDVAAEFTWTQRARGTVDLTNYLLSHWSPPPVPYVGGRGHGVFPSMTEGDWPKAGTGIGDGWEVADSTAHNLYQWQSSSVSSTRLSAVNWPGGDRDSATFTVTRSGTSGGPIAIVDAGGSPSTGGVNVTMSKDGDGDMYMSSYSYNHSSSGAAVGVQEIEATLVAGYAAERQCTEKVSFTLFADVQSILTDPEDGEALRIDDIRSLNLSDTTGTEVPIGDSRRRSYIATERGNRSLEHLIALARAHLMKRSRVVEIAFAPKLSRMCEITLRKNASLIEPRVGEASGKIISYSLALDGSDGRIQCEVRIGCTIGRGGSLTATAGSPTYASIDYVGADYQVFTERSVLLDDTSVGYEPPAAAPNDDGIDFLGAITVDSVIEVPLVVAYPEVGSIPADISNSGAGAASEEEYLRLIQDRNEMVSKAALAPFQPEAKFKLKSMTRSFTTDYEIQMTDLKIPTGYDLEAV